MPGQALLHLSTTTVPKVQGLEGTCFHDTPAFLRFPIIYHSESTEIWSSSGKKLCRGEGSDFRLFSRKTARDTTARCTAVLYHRSHAPHFDPTRQLFLSLSKLEASRDMSDGEGETHYLPGGVIRGRTRSGHSKNDNPGHEHRALLRRTLLVCPRRPSLM